MRFSHLIQLRNPSFDIMHLPVQEVLGLRLPCYPVCRVQIHWDLEHENQAVDECSRRCLAQESRQGSIENVRSLGILVGLGSLESLVQS